MLNILTNASLLTLAGLLLYPALRWPAVQRQGWPRALVLGTLMGVVALMVILQPLLVESESTVDGRAGPLVFAGFLGGPLGGLIAWVFAAGARIQLGGQFLGPSLIGMAGYVLLGTLYFRLTRKVRVHPVERLDVVWLALGSVLVAIGQVFMLHPRDLSTEILLVFAPTTTVANFASVSIIGLLLRSAHRSMERERQLERVQERLELACESAGLGIWDWNLKTNEVVWDRRLAELHGISSADFRGEPREWLRRVLPADRRRITREMRRLIRGTAGLDTEARLVTETGETRHVKSNGLVVKGSDGRPSRVVGVNQDLSSLRQVEQSAREIGWRFEDLASSLPGVILTYVEEPGSRRGTVGYISPGCEDLFELTAEQIMADPSLVPGVEDPQQRQEMRDALRLAKENLTQWFFEWRIRTRSGRVKWLQGRGLPRKRRDGRWQWSVVVLDISEQVRIKEELERNREIGFESRKMEAVGRLTGGVAHDFNNLLSVIVGALSLLSMEEVEGDVKDSIEDAIAACDRGASLTQQLLAFGRQAPLTPVTLDIRTALLRSQQLLERTLPEPIEITSDCPSEPCLVFADRLGLERAVLNLGLNARDAMPSGGAIQMRIDVVDLGQTPGLAAELNLHSRSYVRVTVADTGAGMSREVQGKAFEPFFTTKDVNEGSGLGLAMVHGFARQSGGAVRLDSSPGAGTTVEMYFPQVYGEVEQEDAVRTVSTSGGSEHVLLVEDDPGVRKVLSKQLRRLGYRFTICADGEEGLAALERNGDFDVLLTDVVMPGTLQGPQLATTVRDRVPGIGVVFMTGYSREFLSSDSFDGDHHHLAKPFRLEELDQALRRALDR